MIRLVDMEKSVDTRPSPTFLLRRITLDIAAGEFVTIMGPSRGGEVHPAVHPWYARR